MIVFSVPDSTGLDQAVEVVDARLQAAGIRRLHSRAPSLEQIFLTYYTNGGSDVA